MNLSIEEIEERLRKILLERTTIAIKAEDIRSDVAIVGKGLALDSVTLLEFIVEVEGQFNIILDDNALTVDHFQSFSKFAHYLKNVIEET